MIIKNPTQIKTLPDEMYLENQQAVNEYKLGSDDPFQGVCFPYDPNYQVDYKQCDSDLEKKNEEYVAKVCQKYGLKYVQDGSAICGSENVQEISQDLIDAHNEIGRRMPVSDIDWADEPIYCNYFIYKSWEPLAL